MGARRPKAAFLLAPLAAPLIYYVVYILLFGRTEAQSPAYLLAVYLLGAPIAYITTMVVALPLWPLFKRRGVTNPLWYLLAGTGGGLLVTIVALLWDGFGELALAVTLCLAGAGSAAVFRLLAGRPTTRPS